MGINNYYFPLCSVVCLFALISVASCANSLTITAPSTAVSGCPVSILVQAKTGSTIDSNYNSRVFISCSDISITVPYQKSLSSGVLTFEVIFPANGTFKFTVSEDAPSSVLPSSSTTVIVTRGMYLAADPIATPARCYGETTGTGTVSVNVISSSSSPTIVWTVQNNNDLIQNTSGSEVIVGSTSSISGLKKGLYKVVVSDNMCSGYNKLEAYVTITQPDEIKFNGSTYSPVTCKGGADGYASIVVTGGVDVTYAWTRGSDTTIIGNESSLFNITAGTYKVVVSDGPCTTFEPKTFVITEPAAVLTVGATTITAASNCVSSQDGKITISLSGGAAPTILWSSTTTSGSGSLSAISGGANVVDGLAPGVYTMTVKDSLCPAFTPVVSTVTVGQPWPEIMMVNTFTIAWNDIGSGANANLACYKPTLTGDYVPLGYVCSNSYTAPTISVPVVRQNSVNVAAPSSFTKVWDDAGSGANLDGGFFRPNCPSGYVSLSDVIVSSHNTPATDSIRCILASFTTQASGYNRIWTDSGSGASKDGAVFNINSPSSFMRTSSSYNTNPPTAYVLTFCNVPSPTTSVVPTSVAVSINKQFTQSIVAKDSSNNEIRFPSLSNSLWTATSTAPSANITVSISIVRARAFLLITAKKAGTYSVTVRYNGVQVGSPISVVATRSDAGTDIQPLGRSGFPGITYTIQVTSFDSAGEPALVAPIGDYNFDFGAPGVVSSTQDMGEGTFNVYFSYPSVGIYTIRVSSSIPVDEPEYNFTVTAPLWNTWVDCEISLESAPCNPESHSIINSVPISDVNNNILNLTFCCGDFSEDVPQDFGAEVIDDFFEEVHYDIDDPTNVLAFAGDVVCPVYTYLITKIPSSHFVTTSPVTTVTLCHLNTSLGAISDENDYSCKSHFTYPPATANCAEDEAKITITLPVSEAVFTLQPFIIGNTSNLARIVLCCGDGYQKTTGRVQAHFTVGQVHKFAIDAKSFVNSSQSVSTSDGAARPLQTSINVNIRGFVNVFAVDYTPEGNIYCTMTVSDMVCYGNNTAYNGSNAVNQENLMPGTYCADLQNSLNDQNGTKAFHFTQDVVSGKIISMTFSQSQIDLARSRVNFLKLLDIEIVPEVSNYLRSEKTRLGKEKEVRYTRLEKRDGADCWHRAANGTHYDHEESDKKEICVDANGLARVTYNDTFIIGDYDVPPTSPPIQGDPNSNQQRVPTYKGASSTKVVSAGIFASSSSVLSSLGFQTAEFYSLQSLSRRSADTSEQSIDWEGFMKPVEKRNVAGTFDRVRDTVLKSIEKVDHVRSFITLRRVIRQHPHEAVVVLEEYLTQNSNLPLEVEQMIFGALAGGYSSNVEEMYINMIYNHDMSLQRSKLFFNSISIVSPSLLSDNMLEHLSANTESRTVEESDELNAISVIAGQMLHANDARSELLVNAIETSLNVSEEAGDEAGVLQSLNALGNTHSRRAIPHLRRYLHPSVDSVHTHKFSYAEDSKMHMNKVAAHALRGIKGDDVSHILIDSLHLHKNPHVHMALRKSLSLRKDTLNEEHHERLRAVPNLDFQAVGNFSREIKKGDLNAAVALFSDVTWDLAYENTDIQAKAGVKATLFGNEFTVLEGGAMWSSTGVSDFLAFLYLEFYLPNPLTGQRLVYSLLNWANSASLPIVENAGDLCGVPGTIPNLQGEVAVHQPLFELTYYYGIPLVGGVTLQFEVVGNLGIQYGYAFYFGGRALNPSLNNTQFRASAIPYGKISASVSASVDLLIVSGEIRADVNLVDLRFPVTIAATLSGETACYSVGLDANFLQGDVALHYELNLCIFGDCEGDEILFSWPGYNFRSILTATSCCDPLAVTENAVVSQLPVARHFEYQNVGITLDPRVGTHRRNHGSSRITFSRSPFKTDLQGYSHKPGIPRVTRAESTISTVKLLGKIKIKNGKRTSPAGKVKSYLWRETTFVKGTKKTSDNAGHILAAFLGGTNDEKENFFAQLASINQGSFKNFETVIQRCLLFNYNQRYKAQVIMTFDYICGDCIRPQSYDSMVTFYFTNSTGYYRVPHSSLFKNCPNIPLANRAGGAYHMRGDWYN